MTLGDDVITVRGLTVGYGDRAVLRDLDFTVRRGEVYVLMGPSGCGKTTVLRHLLGLEEPLAGEVRYGWNAFPIYEFGAPSIFASTRKLIASDRALVMNIMQGFVETIHLFKTRPDVVVPLLQRYLSIDDRKAVEELYAFHVPVFQKSPRPSIPGMQTVRDLLVAKYPAAASLKESRIFVGLSCPPATDACTDRTGHSFVDATGCIGSSR